MKNSILLHLHYQDLWPEFWSYLKDIKDEDTDLYVTVNTKDTEWYSDIKSNTTDVFLIENKGMDFGGFLYALDKIKDKNYLTVTKLHGKKSLRMEPNSGLPGPKEQGGGEKWRKELYLPLIKTKDSFKKNVDLFKTNPSLFILANKDYIRDTPSGHFNRIQKRWVNDLIDLEFTPSCSQHLSGSMYMFSKKYLDLLFKNKELELYKRSELGYGLDTIGHYLELLICDCEYFGGKLIGI